MTPCRSWRRSRRGRGRAPPFGLLLRLAAGADAGGAAEAALALDAFFAGLAWPPPPLRARGARGEGGAPPDSARGGRRGSRRRLRREGSRRGGASPPGRRGARPAGGSRGSGGRGRGGGATRRSEGVSGGGGEWGRDGGGQRARRGEGGASRASVAGRGTNKTLRVARERTGRGRRAPWRGPREERAGEGEEDMVGRWWPTRSDAWGCDRRIASATKHPITTSATSRSGRAGPGGRVCKM